MPSFLKRASITLSLSLLAACGSGGTNSPTTKTLGTFRLAQTCEDIQGYVGDFTKRAKNNPGGVVSVQSDGFSRGTNASGAEASGAAEAPTAADSSGGGVSQSDIAVADSTRGLLFTATWEKKLKVFKVSPSGSTSLVTTQSLDFVPTEMLSAQAVDRSLLVVFGSSGGYYGIEPLPASDVATTFPAGGGEESKFIVALYDVSDPAAPIELKRETAPGSFMEARFIPGKSAVLWVTQRWLPLFDSPVASDILPDKTVNSSGSETTAPLAACANTYLYQNDSLDSQYAPYSLNETVVSLMNLGDANFAVSSQAIFSPSWRSVIAANPEHLFLAQNIDSGERPGMELFQFNIAAGSLAFAASGQVEGDIPNQFFIDEASGVVRVFHRQSDVNGGCFDCVAGGSPGSGPTAELKAQEAITAGNYLSTYQASGGSLKLVGRSGPFETSEVPYAARFAGNLGCVITYVQIDPLTCFSLKDPANPLKLGALELGGVSFHLEPVTDDLLLGIGRGADNTSVVANLFDISNPSQPTLASQKTLGNASFAYSPVFYDYRALGKDSLNRNFAVPVDGDGSSSIALVAVSPETKSLATLGTITKNFNQDEYDSFQRAYFFNDTLATVSYSEVGVYLRSNWSQIFSAPLN